LHSLIKRQIKRYLKDIASLPEEFQEFIKAVDNAYHENDADRIMLERAFDLSSQELIQVNNDLRENEEKYRLIAENTADLIVVTDMNLRFTYISPSIMRTHGFTVEEAMNMTLDQVLTPESLQILLTVFEEETKLEATGTADPGRIRSLEIEGYKKDGSIIRLESSFSAQRNKENKPIGMLAVIRDVTERKQAEKKLISSEEKFRLIAENTADLIAVTDMNLRFTYISPSIMRTHGFTVEEAMNMTLDQFLTPESLQFLLTLFEEELKLEASGTADPGRIRILEFEEYKKDGSIICLEGSFSAQRDKENKPIGILAVSRDITDRKQAEKKIIKSEEKFRMLAESSSFAIMMHQGDRFIYANRAAVEISGYTEEELFSMNFWDLVHPDHRDMVKQSGYNRQQGKALPRAYEFKIIAKNGAEKWVSLSGNPIQYEDKPTAVISVTDITERKIADAALKESEIKYRRIFESFEDIYYQTDDKGIIRVLSPSLHRLTGWSPDELIGKPDSDIYVRPKDREDLVAELFRRGFLRDYEVLMKKKDGTQTYASLTASILTDPNGTPCGVAGTLRDITERKQAEKERQQNFERMRKALRATVQSISLTVEMKDPYTSGHQQRVADLARAIAAEMGLSADRQEFIHTASAIHDIGKISIPSAILSKPTTLTDLEFRLIKTHSQSGYDILKDIEFPWPVADVVLQHHERMNGSGYPQGLKGNDISLESRIVAIADVVEAIAFHRPYRPSLGIDLALEEISRNKGTLYDADAVDACLKLFQEKNYTLVL
jgi:PAS domain S-box-containing protein